MIVLLVRVDLVMLNSQHMYQSNMVEVEVEVEPELQDSSVHLHHTHKVLRSHKAYTRSKQHHNVHQIHMDGMQIKIREDLPLLQAQCNINNHLRKLDILHNNHLLNRMSILLKLSKVQDIHHSQQDIRVTHNIVDKDRLLVVNKDGLLEYQVHRLEVMMLFDDYLIKLSISCLAWSLMASDLVLVLIN